MKKTITTIALLAGAASAYSQGQINMNDYGTTFAIQIFTPSTVAAIPVTYGGYTTLEVQGNTVNDDNAGTTTYPGSTPIGAGYEICLLAGAAGDSVSQLSPVAGSTFGTFISTGGGGYWNAPNNLVTIPGITTSATLAIAAWNTEGGTVSSLGLAQATPGDQWGISAIATEPVGIAPATPPYLPAGITSFSLGATPEPSTIALGVIGASAFLMRLRRKQ
jgi:hypothetical protein